MARQYQIKRVGTLEVAPLYFEGLRLFDISAPASRDPNAYPPVAARIDVIKDHLDDVVPPPTGISDLFQPPPTRYDPSTFEVKIGGHNGYLTLSASDRSGAPTVPILTLTEQDAKYNGTTTAELAQQWATTLESVLKEALSQRHPASTGDIIKAILLSLAAVTLVSLLLLALKAIVRRQRHAIEDRLALTDEATMDADGVSNLRSRLRVARTALSLADWLLGWAMLVAWALAVIVALRALPAGTGLAREISTRAIALTIIWLVAGIVNASGRIVIERAARAWQDRPFVSLEEAGRRDLRLPTIMRSLDYAKTIGVYVVAIALTLGTIGASTSAVVTLGAALAFAFSFGAQSLVKDFVNGFFILVEDQYAIGDYVAIGTVAGVIEGVTLRITQLRSDDGRLVTIPNSQVAVVENYTRTWSRVDYRLAVAYDSDVPAALRVFETVLGELAADPYWHKFISQPPRLLGVESMASTGVVLRAWVQTSPGQMFVVTREINRRMLEAMSREEITLAMPTSRAFAVPPPAAQPVAPASASELGGQRDGDGTSRASATGSAPNEERSAREPT
ncbi:MAG: mechanosensitive ion channel family protein [Candidatus Eremiobacteraeota bacterium]|nr:mechanosensitive ion channel family protein [Candidatus Eremiobacteraeota bacterium]